MPAALASLTKRPGLSKLALWSMVTLTFCSMVALTILVLFRPPPATILRVSMETPVVTPTRGAVAARGSGSVRLSVWSESPLDPSCLVSTQYFVGFQNDSTAKLPGARYSKGGEPRESSYEASIPADSPLGPATYSIRDTYNCGLQTRFVETEPLPFLVASRPPTEGAR